MSKQLTKKEEMEQVASISANNDPVIGKLMADAFEKVGKDGVITVEEGKTSETTLEFVEGMQFDKGYISPYFITNPHDDEVRAGGLPTSSSTRRSSPTSATCCRCWRRSRQSGKPLLIIAEDVESEALAALVVNKLRGVLQVCAVKAPGFGDRRKAMLRRHRRPDRRPVHQRGPRHQAGERRRSSSSARPRRSASRRKARTIIDGAGKKADIQKRIEQIRPQMDQTESEYDKEKFSERLAKLTGGVAIIRVGAATEAEMKQTKGRVEDALHATRAAVAEGIVPGGGMALLRAIPAVEEAGREAARATRRLGAEIVARALEKPVRTIAENSGVDGAVVADEVRRRREDRQRRL